MDRLMGVVLAALVALATWGCSSTDGGPSGASSPDSGGTVADSGAPDTATTPGQDSAADAPASNVDGGEADAALADAGPVTATVSGTFRGSGLSVVGGAAETGTALNGRFLEVIIVIAESAPTCASFAGQLPEGRRAIQIAALFEGKDGGPPVATGTFPLASSGTPMSISLLESSAAACTLQSLAHADGSTSTGSVTFTASSETSISGSFTVTWANGDGTMTGTFDVPVLSCGSWDAGADAC